jgi:hypothetical protein
MKKIQKRETYTEALFFTFFSMSSADDDHESVASSDVEETSVTSSVASESDNEMESAEPMRASRDPAANTLLQHFWDLASLADDTRQKAAVGLIEHLKAAQTAHVEAAKKELSAVGVDEADLAGSHIDGPCLALDEDQLEKICAPDVFYSLTRLLRGLTSSRQGQLSCGDERLISRRRPPGLCVGID